MKHFFFTKYLLAAVALIFSACSSDLQELAKPAEPKTGEGIPFSATITMGSDSPTRTLLAEGTDGMSITDTWATGDEVALVYKIGTASHVSEAIVTVKDDHSAEITGTIAAGVTDNTPVTIFYPYTAVVQDDPDTYGTLRPNFSGQKGTLEDIATNFDYRQGEGNLMVSDKATLKESVTMESQIAIWKLTLKDVADATTTLAANKFEIMDKDYKTLTSVEPSPTASEFYVAMPPASKQILNFVATKDENKYYYSKSDVTLEKGKYYQSAMTLTDMLNTPLTLEATEDETVITINTAHKEIKYKINGEDEKSVTGTINLNAGDIVQFFSTNSALSNVNIKPSKKTYVYGNVMSVIDDERTDSETPNFANDKTIGADNALKGLFYNAPNIAFHNIKKLELPATTLKDRCYYQMFCYCTGLTSLPENFLPATTLKDECYSSMFFGCTGLTSVPDNFLPATSLASKCYLQMFTFCSKLKSVPEDLLPATTLKDECYSDMFACCSKLTNAPILPAPTLENKCYYDMFISCDNLSSVTCLATDITASRCLEDWLSGAGTAEGINSRTLYVDPSMTNNDEDRWKLGNSGNEDDKIWTISGDVSSSIALSEVTSKHIGWRIGSDGKAYFPVGNLPGTVTAVAMIASVSSTGHGLAIELNNDPPKKNSWNTACSTPTSKDAVPGCTWKLPSKEEWENIISASGGYGKFKERYKLAAGYEFKTDTAYWTDEAYDDIEAWGIYALTTQYSFGRYYKSSDQNRALACLSF